MNPRPARDKLFAPGDIARHRLALTATGATSQKHSRDAVEIIPLPWPSMSQFALRRSGESRSRSNGEAFSLCYQYVATLHFELHRGSRGPFVDVAFVHGNASPPRKAAIIKDGRYTFTDQEHFLFIVSEDKKSGEGARRPVELDLLERRVV